MASFRDAAMQTDALTGDSGSSIEDDDRDLWRGGLASLSRTIEAEIIPRLMLVHSARECAESDASANQPTGAESEELAQLVVDHDVSVAASYVSVLRARGVSLETVLLRLLAPAANHLDTLWRNDRIDFCEVTIALSRLQQLLRELGVPFEAEGTPGSEEHRVLLAAVPGETHTFGVSIVEEFMRRAGWETTCVPGADVEELGRIVRREWYDVIGLSLSCETLLASLSSAIDIVRRRSRNKRIGVVVGGRYFNEHPESAALVGADLVAFDGLDAVRKAQRLVGDAARAR